MAEIFIWAAVLACLTVGFWAIGPHAYRLLAEARLQAACSRQGVLSLTYDDGPGDTTTGRLLDLFEARGVKATFFLLGRNLADREVTARRLIEAGHEVGSHTFNHANAWKTSPIRAERDYQAGVRAIEALAGQARLFRPPHGKITPFSILSAWRKGIRFGWWTIDSQDSWRPRTLEDVMEEIAAKNGGVLLMHDWDRYGVGAADRNHSDEVVRMTEAALDLAAAKGLRVRPLGDVLP